MSDSSESSHPNKVSGLKDQVVGSLKEGAGKMIASDKMKAEGKLQKEGGKAEKEAAKADKMEKKHDTDEHVANKLYTKDSDVHAAAAEHREGKEKEELGKKTGDKQLEKEGKQQKKIGKEYIEQAIHREKQEGRVDRMEGAAKEAVGKGLDDPVLKKEGEVQQKVGKEKVKHGDTHKKSPDVVHHRVETVMPAEKIEVQNRKRVDIPGAPVERVEVVHHQNRIGGTDLVHVAPTTTEVIHPTGVREVIIPGEREMVRTHRHRPAVRLIDTDDDNKRTLIVPPSDTAPSHVVNDKNMKDFNRKEGTADQFEGRAKEQLGKVLGDKDLQDAGREQRKDGKEKRSANQ